VKKMAKRKPKKKWTLAQKVFIVLSILIAISMILTMFIFPGATSIDGGSLYIPLAEFIV
jgi:hypothetical protein